MGNNIGMGVTSYKRPDHLNLWSKQIDKYVSDGGYYVHIEMDYPDRKGIAYRKNECLRALKDCDYVFLFDDDCFPIKAGWAEFFIEHSKASGQQHFMYLKETSTIKKIESKDGIDIYDNCAGCMMFFTKEVIERVGAYNPKYGTYGFEHAGMSNRIHKAGLTPLGAYSCPAGAGEYIYSMDLDNHLPFNKALKHNISMSDEIKLLPRYVALNKEVYLQDTEIHIPL